MQYRIKLAAVFLTVLTAFFDKIFQKSPFIRYCVHVKAFEFI